MVQFRFISVSKPYAIVVRGVHLKKYDQLQTILHTVYTISNPMFAHRIDGCTHTHTCAIIGDICNCRDCPVGTKPNIAFLYSRNNMSRASDFKCIASSHTNRVVQSARMERLARKISVSKWVVENRANLRFRKMV